MSVFIPGYAQRGKVSVLLVDVKKNTNAWITHGSVTRIDHGTMEKYWAAKLSCHIRFGPVGEFRLFGVLRQKEMRWGIFEQKRFWKVDKKALVDFIQNFFSITKTFFSHSRSKYSLWNSSEISLKHGPSSGQSFSVKNPYFLSKW